MHKINVVACELVMGVSGGKEGVGSSDVQEGRVGVECGDIL